MKHPDMSTNATRFSPLLPLLAVLSLVLGACAAAPPIQPESPYPVYRGLDDGSPEARYAPLFTVGNPEAEFNRIGTPTAYRDDHGRERIGVDPDTPALFVRDIPFATDRAAYVNYVYRIHFTRVPFRLRPSHVTAGRNVGLLAIVTVNADGDPVLLTTVHTCGCYLAFFPTDHLPEHAFPEEWNRDRQRVWGETLPARIAFSPGDQVPLVWLRDGTHRVMDVTPYPNPLARPIPTPLKPMDDLTQLPLGQEHTSFFNPDGWRKGYVKGSFKPLETVVAGWWSWDLLVGSDKAYGPAEKTGTVFYTSLTPWRRHDSDMWPFPRFLAFWGWKL